MSEFDEIAAFYDVMYSDRREDVTMYVDFATIIGGPILECGCGTGRVLFPVAEKGIEIWGIDSSEKMLDIARSKLYKLPVDLRKNVRLRLQNMLDFEIDKTFKLCIIPFRAFMHLLTPEDQNKALRRIHRSLESDGHLVIDIFAPSHEMLAKEKTTIRTEEKVNSVTGQRFNLTDKVSYDHTDQLIHVERHYEHLKGGEVLCHKVMPFTLRYTFRYEMQALLEKNSYRIKNVFGQFDKRPYDYKSGEMIFVAQKHG